jgi:hypothetical protein
LAIIAQKKMFEWEEVDRLGDLDRLRMVLNSLPDEELMEAMEAARGNGRDDYPIRAVWNSVIAGIVFEHKSAASLRRELLRNAQLRQICGFDVFLGKDAVPPEHVYSRFLKSLIKHHEKVDAMFEKLVDMVHQELPEFGKYLAIDGKAIESYGNPRKKEEKLKKADGRRDIDADFGKKTYKGNRKDGTLWEKVIRWFGYQLNLIVDSEYELPVAYSVTKASCSEVKEAHNLLNHLERNHAKILEVCEQWSGDRGYDDVKLIKRHWDTHKIKSVIDIRNQWKDGEETRMISSSDNVVYDYMGTVYCHCPASNERREMAYGGFEQDRESLKYRCPAKQYGLSCRGENQCPVQGSIRIPLSFDRRIFTPLARSSYKWKTAYKKRTAVERVNSRLDLSFGFENHFIRGLKKMKLRCGLALCVMLAMALGRIKENQKEKMRSLVTATG